MDLLAMGIWYCFCATLIFAFIAFYRFVNTKGFRGGRVDRTTEVGFECKRRGDEKDVALGGKPRPARRGTGISIKLK